MRGIEKDHMTSMEAPPAFGIRAEADQDCCRVTVSGELDLATGPALAKELDSWNVRNAPSVVVDFAAVTFIDSSGIAVLMQAARRSREDDQPFGLTHLTDHVRRTLELTGVLDSIAVEAVT